MSSAKLQVPFWALYIVSHLGLTLLDLVYRKRKRGSQKLICLTGKMAELGLKSSYLNKKKIFFLLFISFKKIFSSVFGSSVTY